MGDHFFVQMPHAQQKLIHDILRLELANPIRRFGRMCNVREEISPSAELQKYMTGSQEFIVSQTSTKYRHSHEHFVRFGIVELSEVGLIESKPRRTSISWRYILTCLNVIKILTSCSACVTSWSRFVRILLHATCRYFAGSKAK